MGKEIFMLKVKMLIMFMGLLIATSAKAGEINLDLASFGKEGSAWIKAENLGKGAPGTAKSATGKDNMAGVLLTTPKGSANLGSIQRSIDLAPGFYELTVWAKGQGELTTRAGSAGRMQPLGTEWALYGFLFETKTSSVTVTIGVQSDAVQNPGVTICSPVITPATNAQKEAWAKQEDSFAQFGFYTSSAQRPTPGIREEKERAVRPLDAMTDRVVFWDDRIDYGHATNLQRLIDFLRANGIKPLRSEELAAWMRGFLAEDKDAYGSSCVMPMGVIPYNIFDDIDGKPLWYRYLLAGGRIINTADVPIYTVQSATCEPFNPPSEAQRFLRLSCGWNSPYWGQSLPVKATAQGKAWGFETSDGSVVGYDAETISIPFSVYDVPEMPGRPGAATWLKNFRPDMPWSGLIQLVKTFDGNNDAQLRDVWRAANYAGKTVQIPSLPAKILNTPKALEIIVTANGIAGREELARGEKADVSILLNNAPEATKVLLELAKDGVSVQKWETSVEQKDKKRQAAFSIDTAVLAYGSYMLKASAAGGTVPMSAELSIGIRHVPPESFSWGIWVNDSVSRARRDLLIKAQTDLGMEPHLVDHTPQVMDAVLRQNRGFSTRMAQNNHVIPEGKDLSPYFRLASDWKPMPDTAFGGGRPMVGITHPDILEATRKGMADYYRKLAFHPALRPRLSCNDDFSTRYGFDYAPHVREKFKTETGLDTPGPFQSGKDVRLQIKIPPMGIVSDNEPWLRWCLFTLEHVSGAYNKMETEAVTGVRPDTTIGPIPGGMCIPLIQMWGAGQYPPLNFGKHGFNLGYSYYYNSYWQPVMTNTYWLECNRMGNREIDVWMLADCMGYGLYHRNNLYHQLAGGVKGLPYFIWGQTRPEAWLEIKRQAPVVRKISPVQYLLKPAQRKIGLLLPVTADCYSPTDHLVQPYAYANLVMGHFDVEPVAEEEIIDGAASRYEAIVLYYTRWLRKSVVDALAKYAKAGGKVILDPTIPFDIPGAIRLKVDLGMGREQTKGIPDNQAHLSVPGIGDYGIPERIRAIATELGKHVQPAFDSPELTLTARTFEIDGVAYTWFVNAQSGEEYRLTRPLGSGYGSDNFKKILPWINELEKSRFTAPVTMAKLPGIPYDLGAGKRLAVRQISSDSAFTVDMERMGGTLLAFYPEPIEKVEISTPANVKPMGEVAITVKVSGKSGPIAGAVPLRIDLLDPSGISSPLSGNYATRAGSFVLKWLPATNDRSGKWKIKVEELASGLKSEASVTLEK